MTSGLMDEGAGAPERRFAEAVRRARLERGITQRQLAQLLGAATSWVSQLEALREDSVGGDKRMTPSAQRVEALGQILGGDVREVADQWLGRSALAAAAEPSVVFATLWSARADLLSRMASATKGRSQRMRLDRMAREIRQAAADHPIVQPFVIHGRLQTLSEIARAAPLATRVAVLCELSSNRLDAPRDIGIDEQARLEQLEFLAGDLELAKDLNRAAALGETAGVAARDSLKSPPSLDPSAAGRRRPTGSSGLPPIGGAAGVARAMLEDPSGGLLALLGSDPIGWMDASHISGAWLVCHASGWAEASTAVAVAERTPNSDGNGPSAAAWPLSSSTGPPVLGSALGAAIGWQRASRASRNDGIDLPPELDLERLEYLRPAADFLVALGYEWARIECAKLWAAYNVAGELGWQGIPDLGVPPAATASNYLAGVRDLLGHRARVEEEQAGQRTEVAKYLLSLGKLLGQFSSDLAEMAAER